MRKGLYIIIMIAVVGSLLGYLFYNSQNVTEYYLVSVYPPSWYDSKTKIEVKKTKNYESDSLAIERETNIYHYIQESFNDKVTKAKENSEASNEIIYARFRDEQRCLIKIVHKLSFDFEKLKELIIKHGVNSSQVENYCKNNDIEVSMCPLLSEY